MRIAYLGLDEVNRYFARKWARRMEAGLKLIDVQAHGVLATYPALIVDLDSLPASHRTRWISWLTSIACQTPVLVFGHTVRQDESDALRSCGARVVLRALRRHALHKWMD
jgi:hypothetical protein